MDPDTVKVVLAVLAAVSGIGATMAGVARWGVVRITKAIDDSTAAQLAAAEKYAAAALAQAVAFEALRGEVRAVAEYVHDQPSSRASGSGGRTFTPVR